MNEIGLLIRKNRIEKRLRISDVSKKLMIRKEFIKAIEKNQIDKFSSKAYYDGYTKQYIKFLDLDISDYSVKKKDNENNLKINIPEKDKLNPNLTFVIISILLIIVFYKLFNNYINNITL